MNGALVTRGHLARWGFLRMPDVWLLCPSEGRHKYFERWYHAVWNYTVVIGWPGKDPLQLGETDFLATVQAHVCEDEEFTQVDSWDELYRSAAGR